MLLKPKTKKKKYYYNNYSKPSKDFFLHWSDHVPVVF